SHAYTQRPIKAQIGEHFLADFSGADITRFCARLKALATVLRDLKLPGHYIISHQKGVCRFQKTDINEVEIESSIVSDPSLNATMRQPLIQSRVGQGVFRNRLIERNKKCVLTGVEEHQFLKASHIKPWRVSNDAERLEPDNGLLLSP
ncbi:HNH endonuclease, partial [Vibrio sp. PNB22_3_1]